MDEKRNSEILTRFKLNTTKHTLVITRDSHKNELIVDVNIFM